MLKASNLTRRFANITALYSVDLAVEKGQVSGLLGPNGAGKSTAIRIVCGVLSPSAGSVFINGVNLLDDPVSAKTLIGYLPEGAPLPSELRCIDYLIFVGRLYGLDRQGYMQAISEWSHRCGIDDVIRQTIGTLSRGYRQRLGLAASLIHKPKLVILDEPSTGLDPGQSASYRKLVREIATDSAVLYSSHNLSEVEATCDEVTILCGGRKVAQGTFESLQRGGSSVIVEVSPHSIAATLPTSTTSSIDEDWMRCVCTQDDTDVDKLGEEIATKVASNGGRVRLIQPSSETVEAMYLRLIRESQVQS